MKRTFLFSIFLLISALTFAQTGWKRLNVNTQLNDVCIESFQKVWISNNAGFCLFNSITNQIDTCFNSSNSNLSGIPQQLILANNRLWITTDVGLSSYDGTTIVNYTTANGLLNNSITDMAVDTSGNLWLGSLSGVSYYDGTSFTHDSGIVARQIAIDDLNRVFTIPRPAIFNFGIFAKINVKDQTGWQEITVSGIAPFNQGGPVIDNPKLKKTGGKILVFNNANPTISGRLTYFELTYPAQLDSIDIELNGVDSTVNYKSNDIEIDKNNKTWATTQASNVFMFSKLDSILMPMYVDDLRQIESRIIRAHDSVVFVGGLNTGTLYSTNIQTQANEVVSAEIDVNSIRAKLHNIGPLFNDIYTGGPGLEMPKGNNSYGIYALNYMVSSKRQGDTAFRINQYNFFSQQLNIGPVSNYNGNGGNWIVNITKQEIQNHISSFNQPNYVVPENIANWKGNGAISVGMASQLAGYEDINSNGTYEPSLGDYPKIKGDEAVFWINHKNKLEYHYMVYGFDAPSDSALNQTLFVDFKIFNRDVVAYDSIKVGVISDFDVGNFSDDYIGCDSLENVFFAYNGDVFDEAVNGNAGFGSNIPFVGVKFLSDSMDGFLYFNSVGGNNGIPGIDQEWHYYLNSRWLNGNPVTYGGDGFSTSSNIPTKYMFTGVGSGWSEDTPGFGMSANPPGDRRGLGHIPYFSLQPGESKTVSIAVGYGLKQNVGRLGSLTTLIKVLDSAGVYFDDNLVTSLKKYDSQKSSVELLMYPNPAANGKVYFQVSQNETNRISEVVEIYSISGRLIKQFKVNRETTVLNVDDLKTGVYIVRFGEDSKKLVIEN